MIAMDKDKEAFEAWRNNQPVGYIPQNTYMTEWKAWQAATKQAKERERVLVEALMRIIDDLADAQEIAEKALETHKAKES
jgi:hypothetical protein